jgi:hypothetical protein
MNAVALSWGLRIYFSDSWHFNDVYKGYLVMDVLANLLYFIWGIVGAIKAHKGQMYYFILFGKLAYVSVFKVRADEGNNPVVNAPPSL